MARVWLRIDNSNHETEKEGGAKMYEAYRLKVGRLARMVFFISAMGISLLACATSSQMKDVDERSQMALEKAEMALEEAKAAIADSRLHSEEAATSARKAEDAAVRAEQAARSAEGSANRAEAAARKCEEIFDKITAK
jgi:hypothetical protein